jgi:adenylate cyclase
MIPVMSLLSPEGPSAAEAARIAGAIVLVGVTATGLHDIRATPLGEAVPGVAIQAQILTQILNGQFLYRPAWLDGVEVLAVAVLSVLLVLVSCYAAPAWGLIAAGGITAAVLSAGWYLFLSAGVLVDPVMPLASALFTAFGTTAFWYLVTDSDRRAIRSAFGKYVSPSVLARIEQSPEGLRLGGVNREITVLFMDVRGFTALSERLPPEDIVRLLNRLLEAMSAPVIAREGTLDKYMGDSIMAFWNAPLDVPDHARKAARAALEMMEALAKLNAEDAFGLGPDNPVRAGIGINTGIACVGNMGTAERLSYSAVGDAVNTASRIESACKEAGADILVSEATARLLPDFRLSPAGDFHLKGKSERVMLYALLRSSPAT